MVVGEGFRLVAIGGVLGLPATFPLLKLIASQLYGVSARDPLSFTFVTLLLVVISLFACWSAARKAIAIDPATALRSE